MTSKLTYYQQRKIVLIIIVLSILSFIIGYTIYKINLVPCNERYANVIPSNRDYTPCEADNHCKIKRTSSCPKCLDVIDKCVESKPSLLEKLKDSF
ncbi:hypothetical protein HOE31_01840 [bacterium]|jgi:hypothetical protein|nr:hypothetical protein [bacterium]MBT4121672.1 hypothetical protein [bacterium]MBT4335150.1 hypothetical protein [bacterium]MBT4495551.1 hypothetical protein [bacterium]MBT4764209.1 hypothetical protein [bacterium]